MTWAERIASQVGWERVDYPVVRAEIESALQTALPDDYFDLAARFGEGSFDGLVFVFSGLPGRRDYVVHMWNHLGGIAERSGVAGERYYSPYEIYQEGSSGLIPWGGSDRGDIYFWLADIERDPKTWDVVVKAADGVDDALPNGFSRYSISASEFFWHLLCDVEFDTFGIAGLGGRSVCP